MHPSSGRPAEEILEAIEALRSLDPPTHGGKVLSYVYDPGIEGLDDLIHAAVAAFLPVNGLDPTTFASVAVLERDVVAFGREITHGDFDVVGNVTAGGTESCMLAVKTARDIWRQSNAGRPALVAAKTVHPAFHKACAYFDVDMTPVDVDTSTGAVRTETMLATVDALIEQGRPPALVVLSAPNYPLGAIDPIEELAPALASRGVPVHVDACVGGFVLPFYPVEVPAWDFRVEGVASISLDAHKYGYAPKGASLILYRGRERHQAQYFSCVSWPGYPVVNPTLLGSKSATALAATWAIIKHLGIEGFRATTEKIFRATTDVRAAIDAIPGIKVIGEPLGPLIAVGADDGPGAVDPFHLIDALRPHGFIAQAQPAWDKFPRSAHLTLTPVTASVSDELCDALRAAADDVRGKPAAEADLSLLTQVAEHGLPSDQATIMATLEELPEDMAKAALIGVLARIIDPDMNN